MGVAFVLAGFAVIPITMGISALLLMWAWGSWVRDYEAEDEET